MSNVFRLVSEYKPTGDQPQAIAQLLAGLEKNEREQTLLGVTGSGKSVTGDSPVLTKKDNKVQRQVIGVLIDELFANHQALVKRAGDSEVINMQDLPPDEQFSTFSLNTLDGTPAWRSVTQISRHRVDKLITTRTVCGRSVTSTADHNFFVARRGRMQLVDGKKMRCGDKLPVPLRIPEVQTPLEYIELIDHIDISYRGYCMFEDVQEELLANVVGKQKYWRVLYAGERISLDHYRQYKAASTGQVTLAPTKIGSVKRAAGMSAKLYLTDAILKFIGYYIAEGHATARYITLSTADLEIVSDLEVASEQLDLKLMKRRRPYDYQLASSLLAHILAKWCGRSAYNKRLPEFWPQLTNGQLGSLLSAYFSGDGCVEHNVVTAATSSEQLASDLQYALLRFGIIARVRQKNVLWAGVKRTSWTISISGADYIRQFYIYIGFTLSRKQSKLEDLQGREANTNVDVIPIDSDRFHTARQLLQLLQKDVAKELRVSRSYISMLEDGKRIPSRKVAERLVRYLSEQNSRRKNEFIDKFISDSRTLLGMHWADIKSIEKSQHTCMVYDFAVDGYETFLTGKGGLFVHNTFTMANIIAERQVPALVLAHNKTLAAQLFSEFKAFFPDSAVHYFVSYFDYYQPEAYVPSSDTYIEKDSRINEEIDRLRHAATASLLSRRDVIIVASVSCIYGIGSPTDYGEMAIKIKRGEQRRQDKLIRRLTDIQYQRNDIDFHRSTFRVRGDVVDVFPAGSETAYRIEFFGDEIERMTEIDPLTGEILAEPKQISIFPGSHYVTPGDKLKLAISNIKTELDERVATFDREGKLLEKQRLLQRTKFDLEMLEETGFVKGIENYSRYLADRIAGEQPATLLDYFSDDSLLFIDESHISIPQVRGMYNGDRARKEVLVEHGFRLPSALDNRPLTFSEFERHINKVIYVSATPGPYELSHTPKPVEQVIRPTGLLDPPIEVRPTEGQIDDLIAEIRERVEKQQRVLVTTLTKRMAEDLSQYLQDLNIKNAYIHSDIDTLERGDILRDLRMGIYDVLVGINLLREGLDLPEVSLVAIIDADKEGFLRSGSALVQTVGRAARHLDGRVIMYGDRVTGSMQYAIDETNRRRGIQEAYNKEHGITPTSIAKAIDEGLRAIIPAKEDDKKKIDLKKIPKDEYPHLMRELTSQMELAAANLEFEKAAELRDVIEDIKQKM